MVMPLAIETVVGVLKTAPEIIDVTKDILKKLKPPEELAKPVGASGVSGKDYFSSQYGFSISVPDDSWQFWKPTPNFILSMGVLFTMPWVDVPIIISSKNAIRMFRPVISIIVQDVGSYSNIGEFAEGYKQMLAGKGFSTTDENTHISMQTNSAVLVSTTDYVGHTLYDVMQIYLHNGRVYNVEAAYVPVSDDSPAMFGGMQEILNSFKFIR